MKDNRIKGKVEIELGGKALGFLLRLKDPGTETVIAVCTEAKAEVDGIKQVTSKAKPLVEVPNYTRSVAKAVEAAPRKRAIEVEAPAGAEGVRDGKVKVPAPAPASFRTAIKVEVKVLEAAAGAIRRPPSAQTIQPAVSSRLVCFLLPVAVPCAGQRIRSNRSGMRSTISCISAHVLFPKTGVHFSGTCAKSSPPRCRADNPTQEEMP